MVSSSWTAAFPGWEQGSYHNHPGVYRRRPDHMNIRVLRHEPPVPCPVEVGEKWPTELSWMLSFWRLRDSESFHVVGPDSATLHEVLSLENLSVETLLVELNQRCGLRVWASTLPGFEWTGHLDGGAAPPETVSSSWPTPFLANGWSLVTVDGKEMAEKRLGNLLVRIGVDPSEAEDGYTPQVCFLEFAQVGQTLRRVFGGEEVVPAGELYFAPWRDTRMVLEFLADLQPGATVEAIRSWLHTSSDAAVEFVAPDAR